MSLTLPLKERLEQLMQQVTNSTLLVSIMSIRLAQTLMLWRN